MDIFDLMELRFPEKHGTIIRYRNASAKLEADSVKMTVAIPVDGWDETRVCRESRQLQDVLHEKRPMTIQNGMFCFPWFPRTSVETRLALCETMMRDLVAEWSEKTEEEPMSENQRLIHRYLCAMANFYGALTVQQAFRIIEQQNPGLTTQDEVSAVLHREEDNVAYCEEFDGEEVVCEEWFLGQPEEYRGLVSARQGKPIYIPPKDELLRYEDELYFENTPATQAMRDFFKTELGVAREDVEDMLGDMVDICRVGDIGMESAVNEMKPYLTTQRLLEKFLLLYTELHNTTRMPENYGHTPTEICESGRIKRTVGRNDPCPCGSGKKYKKCCGRNVN